ncbi:MAG: hypothetical protein A2751_01175 [Candidatus Doudnabacteria bacterium RIFCSPHIGHO2_01_FULL_46_14]|uniref:NADPH-dependent FMN reductase-like domain-containing protein n=1 Tax=Candidatus Doudnabacteria bacterium RIFCSPHIGHO2_01_FULL_46_14 TaxID=1817824 RepID=A0A1F5NNB3_9BACT|nr:MAG: hypothetical protein A2751_01175 [Candidatus Doudnabacteria bacterium RIFCSPHIGHO2_01_FULL_46_14]
MKILIILGSTRPNRESEKVGRWVLREIQKRAEFDAELIDLRDWPLPFYNEVAGPESINGNYSIELAKKWEAKVGEADGFIIIAPEYNHGYPAVLKNALDYTYISWNKKPVSFVSYGGSAGGARSVEQLRQVAVELQMAPLHKGVHIPMIWTAWDETGNKLKDELAWSRRLVPLFDELAWWTKALKTGRQQG